MSKRVAIATIVLMLTLLQFASPTGFVWATPDTASAVTLYGHAPPPENPEKGPILNALPQWGSQQAARLQDGAVFTLDPPLGGSVLLEGTVTIDLWVRAENRLTGFLSLYLSENTRDGRSITIPGSNFTNSPLPLDSRPPSRPERFGVLVNYTLVAGSMIQLHVKYSSSDKLTNAYLLYDSPTTQTKITISTQGPSDAKIDLLTKSGEPSRVFKTESNSANASMLARINITDSFGLYRLDFVNLKISDSSGKVLVSRSDFLAVGLILNDYTESFEADLNLPEGAYVFTVAVTDRNGNTHTSSEEFFVAVFHKANIRVIDTIGRPIFNAELVASNPVKMYTFVTNQTGWTSALLPSSKILGQYQLTVSWRNISLPQTQPFYVDSETVPLTLIMAAFDLKITVKLRWFDLPGARVDLIANRKMVSSGTTNGSGDITFTQIPLGRYVAEIYYFGVASRKDLTVSESTSTEIEVPFPYEPVIPYVGLLIFATAAFAVILRRRKHYESPFQYIDVLTKGGLPNSCTTTIVGASGSGKTVLMESLAHQTLKAERGCVYVTNVELPSNVRSTMSTLGMDLNGYEPRGRLLFIDCYSALSGTPSKEKMALASFTDLTSLGILITAAMDKIGGITDVYFDSLTPLFNTLKSDYVVSFIQSVGAKVKSYNGRLCATIGTSIDKETLTKIEEISDCVIEMQLVEARSGQKRRLRIKKLRGHPYVDVWTRFKIAEKQGITFFTRKPFSNRDLKK